MTKKMLIQLMKALEIEFIEPDDKSHDFMKHSSYCSYMLVAKRGTFVALNGKLGREISKLWRMTDGKKKGE